MSKAYLPSPPVSPTPQRRSTSNQPRHSSARTASGSSISSIILTDPFAANAKATQAPPLYHQGHRVPRTPEPESRRVKPSAFQLQTPPAEVDLVPRKVSFQSDGIFADDPQKLIWEEAIDSLFAARSGEIDLRNKNLTYIPPIVSDASKLVVLKPGGTSSQRGTRLLSRAVSAPATTVVPGPSSRSFDRTKTCMFGSNSRSTAPDEKETVKHAEIELLLGSNSITTLPNELFLLRGLTVLSLRSNQLTHVPAAIACLVNLEELNLYNNRISYMPSEILGMNLKKLLLNANPLLQPPRPFGGDRVMSPLVRHRRDVRSLLDIATSVLLSPPLSSATEAGMKTKTKLEEIWELPLPSGVLNAELVRKIDAALPRSCRSRTMESASRALRPASPSPQPSGKQPATSRDVNDDDAGMNARYNVCPSPNHLSRTMFVDHGEERFEWIKDVVEVVVSDLPGGAVPIRWRGCSAGCLGFLEKGDDGDTRAGSNPAKGMVIEEQWEDEFELDA
ncbi:hypothetical protein FS837_011999 [Tulasnella sp. UAMH 9824]|nr:hypothetical protein FS837_011999 [Tulasnella sp. UAMH 9824]